jgi:phosphatidylserine synthase
MTGLQTSESLNISNDCHVLLLMCFCYLVLSQLLLLENVRFYKEEEKNVADFAEKVILTLVHLPILCNTTLRWMVLYLCVKAHMLSLFLRIQN